VPRSGDIVHGLARNDLECIRIALKIAKRLAFQDMALDFLKDTVALPSSVRLVWFCCGAVAACAVWWMKPSIGTRVAFGHRMPFSNMLEHILRDPQVLKSKLNCPASLE